MICRMTLDAFLTNSIHFGALFAPLHFARNTVVVSIHLRARTVAQEKRGLFAGVHLRAVSAAITGVGMR